MSNDPEPSQTAAETPVAAKPTSQPLDDALAELRESAPHLGGLPDIKDSGATGSAVWQIELDLQVVLGSAAMSVAELLELKAGGTITLDQDAGQPLELAVNGRTIGFGELVEDPAGGLAIRILRLHDLPVSAVASDAA